MKKAVGCFLIFAIGASYGRMAEKVRQLEAIRESEKNQDFKLEQFLSES